MIDFGPFYFATAPGTGADWFIEACRLAGLDGLGQKWKNKEAAAVPFDEGENDKLKVSLVCHPIQVLFNIYLLPTWDRPEPFKLIRRREFSVFASVIARQHPGSIGRMVDSYEANTVLRSEDQPNATIELFGSLNIPLPLLQWDKPYFSIHKDEKYMQVLAESEKEMMERYDYVW